MAHDARGSIGYQIQLDTSDPLWEWHIPTDMLFLSEGARLKLRLENDVPATMAAFAAHSPPDCLPALHELLEGVLSGANGPMLEMVFPFDDLMVRASLLVVERNSEGRAVRAVGQYSVSGTLAYRPPVTSASAGAVSGDAAGRYAEGWTRILGGFAAAAGGAEPTGDAAGDA